MHNVLEKANNLHAQLMSSQHLGGAATLDELIDVLEILIDLCTESQPIPGIPASERNATIGLNSLKT